MAEITCPECRQRDAQIAALQRRVGELEALVRQLQALLNRNSSNSSVPPSANPPSAPTPVVKKPTGKKPGGQPGHPPALRQRLPADRVHRLHVLTPTHCRRCHAPLAAEAGPNDPEPTWHQVAELPRQPVQITEYQGCARTCSGCGEVTHAALPAEIKAYSIGPRLAAGLAYLTGRCHLSKRAVEEVVETLFGVPLALGTVSRLESQVSDALAAPHAEAAEAVCQAAVKHVDETGWRKAGRLCWLWAAVTHSVALFVVHRSRGVSGLAALLGEAVTGILCSDRWRVYERLPVERRQLCWAHLKRDFQAMVDRDGKGADAGANLLALTSVLFAWWYKVRDGTRTAAWLQRRIEADLRPDVVAELRRGSACGCAPTAATCRELLAWEPALWTFAYHEGVEPTNNRAERALRPAVLWRKRSFGCHSDEGCRFVERLLTVVQTLRLQSRDVLDYLQAALTAHRNSLPAPKLLNAG
jgi:transposase